MTRRLIFACAALLLCLPLRAQLYQPGEVLDYRVSYRAKLFPNTEVGYVQVTTEAEAYEGEPMLRITAHGKTLPSFRWLMRVDDRYTTLVDRQTLRTRRFESDIREGNYRFWSNYTYDWPALKVRTNWQGNRMQHDTVRIMDLTPKSMDPVSLYFHLRGIDPETLEVGRTEVLEMLLEDTIRHLQYRFLGREEKKIRKMGRFRTLKFACQIGTSEGYTFTDGSEFTVWISDDRNLIPLYIESPIRVGSVQAYLTGYDGLRYPLSSKIK